MTVPVDPDAETARRWAVEELADPIYHRGPSLLDRFLEWLRSLFEGAPEAVDLSPVLTAVAVVVVLGVLVAAAFWFAGPVRLSRRSTESLVVLGDDTRTAAELRAAADVAAARGDWSAAVLDRFRALVRSLEERALLDDRPGRTAHEAGEEAGARLPTRTDDLRRAARLFDDVCYGHVAVDASADAWLRSLDAEVAGTRPTGTPAVTPAITAAGTP